MIKNIFLFFQYIVEWNKFNVDRAYDGCIHFSIASQVIAVCSWDETQFLTPGRLIQDPQSWDYASRKTRFERSHKQ